MPGKHLGLPCPDGASQPAQLTDLDAICPAVEALQRPPGIDGTVGGIDGPEQLLALPGRGHLTGGISSHQPSL
jgi:hypothetical protein